MTDTSHSQLLNGSDNFNSASLDTSKWTVWGGPNFVKTDNSVSFLSTTSTEVVIDGIYWNQGLPTDQNWAVTIEVSISPLFGTTSPDRFVEALLTIASDTENLNSYFTNCLHRDNTFDVVPNWAANNASNQETLLTVGLNSVILKMEYNANAKYITSSYADISSPNNFIITASLDVSNWLNMSGGFKVLVGGCSNDATISSGLLTLDNFQITSTIPILEDSPSDFTYSGAYGVSIDHYNGTAAKVVIPSRIDGKPVTRIGYRAFMNNTQLSDVTIPITVTSIMEDAFYNCDSLASISIPYSITNIGGYLGNSPFRDCDSLSRITVDSKNPNYSSDDAGVLFNKSKSLLIQYPIGNPSVAYSIPVGVNTIKDSSFLKSISLTDLLIPDSVNTIERYAFNQCSNLKNVSLGSGVTEIGDLAFTYCYSLTSINIPNSVKTIGFFVFEQCKSLASVFIGNGLTTITTGAFSNCESLTSVNMSSITTIEDTAFAGCKSLTSISIPNSVLSIGRSAFGQCSLLSKVIIGKNVATLKSDIFENCPNLSKLLFLGNSPSNTGSDLFFLSNPNGGSSTSTPSIYYLSSQSGWGATFAGRPTIQIASPSISSLVLSLNGSTQITWTANIGSVYVIDSTDNLSSPFITRATVSASSAQETWSDPDYNMPSNRFYRIGLAQP